jgi:hypothetical protein
MTAEVSYVEHYRHGTWAVANGNEVTCPCGTVLYLSRHAPETDHRRLTAAVALDRALEAQRDGYHPPEHYRASVELRATS